MRLFKTCASSALLALLPVLLTAQEADRLKAKLEALPKPWARKLHRLTEGEYEATLSYWQARHPRILKLETPAKTKEGSGIHLLRISEPGADDADKQVALITALHGGPERSGTTTCMRVIEWLLSDDAEALETRRKQIVLLMPIINPHGYFTTDRFGNSSGIDPYTGGGPQNWDLKTLTYKAGKDVPEVKAFLDVVDRFKPDVHLDLHGTGLQEYSVDQLGDRKRYAGQTMFEVTGSAYSNYALRPWDWRVTEAMIAAGVSEGYPSDRFEADAQRAYWGPAINSLAHHTWRGRPNFYTAQYAYAKYHTMVAALEIGWEASGLARTRGLLRIGNGRWPSRVHEGYPVDRVRSFIGHYITAYGSTASQRRRSRTELWKIQPMIDQGVLYPQTDGRMLYVAAIGGAGRKLLDADPVEFVSMLRGAPNVDADAIKTFIDAGPEIKLAIDRAPDRESPGATIEHGLAFHLRIPHREPELVDVRLNGRELERSATNGFQSWFGSGFTHLRINVPPDRVRGNPLFVITCAYRGNSKREYGWSPPEEVLEQLRKRR